MTLLWSYIWRSYVGAPVWYVKSLPALHPAGTAATGEEQDADGVKKGSGEVRPCMSFISLVVYMRMAGSESVYCTCATE